MSEPVSLRELTAVERIHGLYSYVPTTLAGKMRCDSADLTARPSPVSSVSISRPPPLDSTTCCTAIRPDSGVHPTCTENRRISNKPHQKIGIE